MSKKVSKEKRILDFFQTEELAAARSVLNIVTEMVKDREAAHGRPRTGTGTGQPRLVKAGGTKTATGVTKVASAGDDSPGYTKDGEAVGS